MLTTIKVGTVTLKLGRNKAGMHRYEGFSESGRVLVRQDPWGSWSACIVKKEGRGSMITANDNYASPGEAAQALIEKATLFHKALGEVLG
jgi:hypothetical protein